MTCFGDAATCRVYVFMLYHLQLGRLTGQLTYLPARDTTYTRHAAASPKHII